MPSKKNKHAAFSLVELLCAIFLASIIMTICITILSGTLKSCEHSLALSEARHRGEMVLQILRLPVENAGLGLPSDPMAFRQSMVVGSATLSSLNSWQGPVSVSGNELRLVYAVPTSNLNQSPSVETSPSEDATVTLSIAPQAGQLTPWSGVGPAGTRSWVAFAPSSCPFLVTGLSNRTIRLRSSAPSWIPHNASLHYLRAMRALVVRIPASEPAFCTEDMSTGSGLQERVLGVAAFRVRFDPSTRMLTLAVLSRGGRRHARAVYSCSPAGWLEPVLEEDRRYTLAVTTWSCLVRNGGEVF